MPDSTPLIVYDVNDIKFRGHTQIPDAIDSRPDISGNAKRVYGYLLRSGRRHKGQPKLDEVGPGGDMAECQIWPSLRTISKQLAMPVSTVRRSANQLEKQGLIVRWSFEGKQTFYALAWLDWMGEINRGKVEGNFTVTRDGKWKPITPKPEPKPEHRDCVQNGTALEASAEHGDCVQNSTAPTNTAQHCVQYGTAPLPIRHSTPTKTSTYDTSDDTTPLREIDTTPGLDSANATRPGSVKQKLEPAQPPAEQVAPLPEIPVAPRVKPSGTSSLPEHENNASNNTLGQYPRLPAPRRWLSPMLGDHASSQTLEQKLESNPRVKPSGTSSLPGPNGHPRFPGNPPPNPFGPGKT